MTIQQLADKLKQYSQKGDLSFENIAKEAFGFSLINGIVPFSGPVTLTDAPVVQTGDNKISIKKNNITWGKLNNVGMEITFEAKDQDIVAGLSITLPKGFPLPILHVDWLPGGGLGSVTFSLQTTARKLVQYPLGVPVTGFVSAVIQVNDIGVPIKIGLHSTASWYLQGDFSSIDFPGLVDVLSLLTKPDDVKNLNLPDTLNNLTKIALYQVTIEFNPGSGTVSAVTIEIGSSPKLPVLWDIIPGVFQVKSYRVALDILNPVDSASRAIGGMVTAGMHFGGSDGFDVDISAIHPPKGCWEFKGETGKDQPVKIGALVGDLAEKFAVTLPDVLTSFSLKNVAIDFNTASGKDFKFSSQCTCDFTVADKAVELTIAIRFTGKADGKGFDKQVDGRLTVGTALFNVSFAEEKNAIFSASWSDKKNPLQFVDIARVFGSDELVDLCSQIPSSLDLALTDASFTYNFTDKQLVFTAASQNYGNAVFIVAKIKENWAFVFALGISKESIDLADLPLIGSDLAKIGTMGIKDFNLIISSAAIDQANVKGLNTLIKAKGKDYPTLPEGKEGLKKGVGVSMQVQLGKESFPVALGTGSGGQKQLLQSTALVAQTPLSTLPVAAGDTAASTYWINLQKALGPVYFDKVGLRYQDNYLYFVFNVALITAALKIDLDGLSIGSSLKKIDPVFDLAGLSITFSSGPVQISGGFLKTVVNGVTEYNGQALIKTGAFNLSALGSYATVNGQPSLFIFALLNDPPLGGPPYFFVTGVAAGFGYNRYLKIPSVDEVPQFPLTSGFVPGQGSPFSGSDPGKALQVLVEKDVVAIAPGEDWLAGGVRFTTFEMLQSFALLVIEFGTDLEIALIGMSGLSVPTGAPTPLVKANLALSARLLPSKGELAVEAKLTPDSYLLSKDCHLTGGFAFYVWFSPNEHAGDFVVTLGGYHPNFKPPDYYPQVPRLGFNWVVTSELNIKGGMYFALTPVCLMAGGGLQAVWQSGSLKAWFDLGADFLIAWKPYHYEALMYINFGVSYTFDVDLFFFTITKTISVSLGADLSIWGPEFSGIAHIHLWIISFSISFGAGAGQEVSAISWDEFKNSFLPNPAPSKRQMLRARAAGLDLQEVTPTATVCSIKVTDGLIQDIPAGKDNPEHIDWIVNRQGTVLETGTLIPAKDYVITIKNANGSPIPTKNIIIENPDELDKRNKDFGVGLVRVDNSAVSSSHTVVLVYEDGPIADDVEFHLTALLKDVPKSLWENRQAGYDKETLIKNALVGFDIRPAVPEPDQSLPIDLKNLDFYSQPYKPNLTWSKPDVIDGPGQVDPMNRMQTTINSPGVVSTRAAILAELVKNGFIIDTAVDVADIAKAGSDYIFAPPLLHYTYWKKAAKPAI